MRKKPLPWKIVPYDIRDELSLSLRPDDRVWHQGGATPTAVFIHATSGPAVTILDEAGQPIACGGITVLRPGLGELWGLFDQRITRYPLEALVYSDIAVRRMIGEGRFRRVQAFAKADNRAYTRFLERLGFEREAICRAWGPEGADYALYARVA